MSLKNLLTCCFVVAGLLTATAFKIESRKEAKTQRIDFQNFASSRLCVTQPLAGEIPKEIARKFRRDASRLALRLAAGGEDFRYLGVYISRENTDLIYNALAAVYLNDERGRSLESCNIHTFPSPSIDHLTLIYQRAAAWAQPLQAGLNETSSPAINDLLERYHLVIEKHVNWTDAQDAIAIRSRDPLNMAAVANELNNVEGVDEVDLGIPKVVGNDIAARRVNGGWELDYVLRFGSWASGAGKAHTWKFRVTDAGKTSFVSESGEAVPEWMKCQAPAPKNWAGL